MQHGINTLRLLQLADSALPIGSVAHSFGLETLVDERLVTVDALGRFLRDMLQESGTIDAWHCREGHRLGSEFDPVRWVALNRRFSALKLARESRAASATLGRRFLQLVAGVHDDKILTDAITASKESGSDIHQCTAFGLVGGVLGFSEDDTVLAQLQQSVLTQISAAQRLLPLGQHGATRLLWDLQADIVDAADRSMAGEVTCFTPLIEMASMRHPSLATRLFIS